MHNGATRKLALQKNVICEDCNGIGGREGAVQRCTNCRGSGMQVRLQQLGPGIMQQGRYSVLSSGHSLYSTLHIQ